MKSKNYVYILMALLIAGVFSSCSDWLDYTPKDKETEDQTFSSKAGFYTAVNGVYNRLISNTMYGKNLTYGMLDIMGKRYETPSKLYYSSGGASLQASLVAGYRYSEEGFVKMIENIWEEAYATILNVNVILDNAEQKKGSVLNPIDYNLVKGDMLALRAFLHFDLLRMFGPVYRRDAEKVCIPYNDSRVAQAYELLSSRSIVYDHLIPDLNEAEKCLKESDPVLTEGPLNTHIEEGDNYQRYRQLRLNYYAAVLLKARVYLWANDLDNALLEAQKITDDPKVKEFFPFVDPDKLLGNTVNPDRTYSTEVLFGFYDSGRNDIYTSTFDAANLSGSVLLQPRAGYVASIFTNTADYRYQSQWTISSSSNSFLKYKAIILSEEEEETKIYPFYTYFMPLMHVSEAYYIAAEALLNRDLPAARGYMDTIMEARGRTAIDPGIGATALLEEIKKEYIREMWGEGQTFYLFKRHFQRITAEYNGNSTGISNASDAMYVLPLPESELINR